METIHFTIGEDAGKLVMKIAQEHLVYEHNPEQAIKTFTDSLGGEVPMDLVLKLLTGEYVLEVDVENQMFILNTKRDEVLHSEYPMLNIKKWYIHKAKEILEHGNELRNTIDTFKFKGIKSSYKIDIDYQTIIAFCNGDIDELEDFFLYGGNGYEDTDLEKINNLALLIKVTKDYITKSIQIQETISWLRKTYPREFINEESYVPRWLEYQNILGQVNEKLVAILEGDYLPSTRKFKELDNYIEAAIEIDDTLSKGIKPVDIMDNWSAGWLAPNGDFYGLNGEIANMLHNQIADGLLDIGIIPEDYEKFATSTDSYLGRFGWVKIHGNNVQFEGCNNFRLNKPNVNLTPIQIKKIYEYIAICHKGQLKLGWKMEFISATIFQDIANGDIIAINKKYFEY